MFGYRIAEARPNDLIGEFGENRQHKVYLGPIAGSPCYALRIDTERKPAKILIPMTCPEKSVDDISKSLRELLTLSPQIRTKPGWLTAIACFIIGKRVISSSSEVMCLPNQFADPGTRYGNGCRFFRLVGWSQEKILLESFSRGNKGSSSQLMILTEPEARDLMNILEQAHSKANPLA